MKKLYLLFSGLLFVSAVCAQNDSLQAPYKRFPFFPPVKLLLPDSVSYFTKSDIPKKKSAMLMLFSPQCEHCQQETGELIKHIDQFKDILVVMATSMPFDSMFQFIEKYKLASFKNIIVAQDVNYFLFSYYQSHFLPFLAFYNKKKELISVFEGGMSMDKILKEFDKQ